MKLIIGGDSIEITDAIHQLQSNIQLLKFKLTVGDKSECKEGFSHLYGQKIEALEMLVDCLSEYDSKYNHALSHRDAGVA